MIKKLSKLKFKLKSSVAICTTGCGEHIMKTIFAKECSDFIMNQEEDMMASSLNTFMGQKFFSKIKKF